MKPTLATRLVAYSVLLALAGVCPSVWAEDGAPEEAAVKEAAPKGAGKSKEAAKDGPKAKPARQRDAKPEKAAGRPGRKRDAADEPAAKADSADYQEQLRLAREQRDRELDAAGEEKDPAKLQKQKQEIFAKYAAIVAKMGDRARAAKPGEAANPGETPTADAGASADPDEPYRPTAKGNGKPERVGRPRKRVELPSSTESSAGGSDSADAATAGAERRLEEETELHEKTLAGLQRKLEQAEASGNAKTIRTARKAVERENEQFEAKRAMLQRRIADAKKKAAKD